MWLVNTGSAAGTTTAPWCAIQRTREVTSNYFNFSLNSDGKVQIEYLGPTTGSISFSGAPIWQAVLGFTGSLLQFNSGTIHTATYQPYGAVFVIGRSKDTNWQRTVSQTAYQELPTGEVHGWSDGYVKSTRQFDLDFLPTNQDYKDALGSPATPALPVSASTWGRPPLIGSGYAYPFTFSHFMYACPGVPVAVAHSNFQENVSGTDRTFDVVYVRPKTLAAQEQFTPSVPGFRKWTSYKSFNEILSSSAERAAYTSPTIIASPAGVTGAFAWFSADNVTNSGTAVSAWLDKTGYGRHVTQSVTNSQPYLSSSDISYNDRPVLYFDGGDNLDLTANASFNLTQPFTAYLVGEVDKDAAQYATYFDSVTTNRAIYRIDTTITASNIYAGSTFNPTGSIDRNSKKVSCVVFNTANSKYYVSGASGPELIGSGNVGTDYLGRLRVGYGYNAYPFTGKIAELIFFTGSHDTSTITTVMDYLDDKYWTPSDIPDMHAWWSARAAVTRDGLVTQLTDLSGRERHLIQTIESRRPAYLSAVSGLNNKPSVLFTGGQKLETAATHTLTRKMTVFFVMGNIVSRGMVLEHGVGSSAYFYSTGTAAVFIAGSSGVGYHRSFQNPVSTWMTEYQIAAAVYDGTNPPTLIGGNNTTLSTTSTDGVAQSNSLAAYWFMGSRQNDTLPHSGMVSEVLVYNRNLTSAERARVFAYLQALYGIT